MEKAKPNDGKETGTGKTTNSATLNSSVMYQKNVHYSQDYEQAIIGACLLEQTAYSRVYETLKAEYFYFEGYKEVYEAMKWMYENSAPIDLLTVTDYLIRKRGFAEFHGFNVPYFLAKTTNNVVSASNLEYYAQCCYAMWIEREIIRLTYSGPPKGDLKQQINELQGKLTVLNSQSFQKDWYDMTDLMMELYKNREEMQKKGGVGIPMGIKAIDKANGGLGKGQMVVIGARPSVGKSAFIGGVAVNMAKAGYKVGIISLEMNNIEISNRLAAIDTETDFHVLFRGLQLDQKQQETLYRRISQHTAQLPIFVTDKTDVNILQIKSKAMKLKHSNGLDCLIIDYLQLVDSVSEFSKNRNRENEVAQLSRGCKLMAKELDIPVIVLCQLNRQVTSRKGTDRYPQLQDLRESGSIEQDADAVMFLHRDWLMGVTADELGNSTEREADLIIRKWRNGVSNMIVKLDFDPPKMKFTERQNISTWKPVPTNHYEKESEDDNPF